MDIAVCMDFSDHSRMSKSKSRELNRTIRSLIELITPENSLIKL